MSHNQTNPVNLSRLCLPSVFRHWSLKTGGCCCGRGCPLLPQPPPRVRSIQVTKYSVMSTACALVLSHADAINPVKTLIGLPPVGWGMGYHVFAYENQRTALVSLPGMLLTWGFCLFVFVLVGWLVGDGSLLFCCIFIWFGVRLIVMAS